ncbi:hypothetical protein Trydic_g5055 [Trypoxylus dichotomus]
MEVYRISSRLLLLLGILCLSTTLQGVQGGAESEGPSESECRPYIEKALKELETAEAASSEPITPGDSGGDSKEEDSTVEITTNDSDHEGDGDNDDEAEESKESAEGVDVDQADEATSSKEEADDDRSEEEKDQDASAEDEKVVSEEQSTEDTTDEEKSKEDEDKSGEGEEAPDRGKSAEESTEEAASAEQAESAEEAGSDEADDKRERREVDQSAEDKTDEDERPKESKESEEDDKSAEAGDTGDESRESTEIEPPSAEETPGSDEAQQDKSGEADASAEDQERVDDKSEEGADDQSTEADQPSAEEGESTEDAASHGVDEDDAGESEGDDSKETEAGVETTSAEEESEEGGASKEDDGVGDQSADDERDSDVNVSKDAEASQQASAESEEEVVIERLKRELPEEEPSAEKESEEQQQTEEEEQKESKSEEDTGSDKEALEETVADEESEGKDSEEEEETTPEEDLINEGEIPDELRPTDHIWQLLKLDNEHLQTEKIINNIAEITLRDLKRLYENAIKPLETLYKYRDLSNRHFGDSEIFSKPLVLFMGPWSGGKSSIINYLANNEYNETSLRTGAEPSPAYFNILMYGDEPEVLDGTQLAADFTFSGLQKFGQGLEERLRGLKLPQKLLQKINIVEIPGILEVRKQISRVFPFNDACQWFIDRADIIYLVYDPSKLDVGPETEAILDQLKGREHQTRIILNKADQVKPEELMRVQGALIWNISPLMSSAQPPLMYTTSLWSRPYEIGAPVRLLQAQERAFLRDLRGAIDKRIENKIASARRFAVRVRNHAKMVDCYLTTYYNHKSVFGNRKQVSDAIIEHPQDYHIYEGLSTLTNISRYDLPDPDVYRDFFRLNPLYDFQQLSATCTYFRGCPINRLDVAIAYDLPELVGKHKRMVEAALAQANLSQTPGS